MPNWNCRLIERNGYSQSMPWVTVEARSAKQAAADYCDKGEMWDCVSWSEDDEAIVEVEMHGGQDGIHRMKIGVYTVLQFSATPEGDE